MNFCVTNQKAFTLIELLISMMVFSILSVMAYTGLQSVIDTKEHTEKAAQRLVTLQTAFMFIGRDIEQTIGRSVRDGFGDIKPALEGGEYGKELLSFTHAGYTNYLKATRSSLQRVAYRLEDNELLRVTWPMLDQDFNGEDAYKRVLLDKVEKVEISYVDREGALKDQWPSSFGEVDETLLPRAVIFNVEIENLGKIRRVFRVPPGENIVKNNSNNNNNNGNNNAAQQ